MINLNRLKGLRVENGFTQKEMAKRINMPEATYQKKESGETQFLLIEADKIARVFQKDIKDIFFTN